MLEIPQMHDAKKVEYTLLVLLGLPTWSSVLLAHLLSREPFHVLEATDE